MNFDLSTLLKTQNAANVGPHAKELLLLQAEKDFDGGNMANSIFYQVCALYQSVQELYFSLKPTPFSADERPVLRSHLLNMQNKACDIKDPLERYATEYLAKRKLTAQHHTVSTFRSSNFLYNITEPSEGIAKIMEICQQLPKEWTVLQLCKGPQPSTTYQVYEQIRESHAPIYLTILKHACSEKYPEPVCLRLTNPSTEAELYQTFANIGKRLKKCVSVDPRTVVSNADKRAYWAALNDLDKNIEIMLAGLKDFFFPWNFLFTGSPFGSFDVNYIQGSLQSLYKTIHKFCDDYNWSPKSRILLCLAMLHSNSLSTLEMVAICNELTQNPVQKREAEKLLAKSADILSWYIRSGAVNAKSNLPPYFPCILILDGHLDHFFWEEMNVEQDFYRFNSLQCLWRLYQFYRSRIENGYLMSDITDGGCIINPENNLLKMELRMRSFFEYWTPNWLIKCGERPTRESLFDNMFKRDCYVYCGHGNGLQFINGQDIVKQKCDAVTFLFGCDSTRSYSNGLYSELLGTHLYYHAALCPTLVGTILPALDCFVDHVAACILSRWIKPTTKSVMNWQEVSHPVWLKSGVIQAKSGRNTPSSYSVPSRHQTGCLGLIVTSLHQRTIDSKYYNTILYVCRGLPVWNRKVQAFPY